MARVSKVFTTTSTNSVAIAAVNAYLATITNAILRAADLDFVFKGRAPNPVRMIAVTTDTGGGAIATPWLVTLLEATSAATLETAIAAFYTANPTSYIGAPRSRVIIGDNGLTDKYVALIPYNATAGASANYLLL